MSSTDSLLLTTKIAKCIIKFRNELHDKVRLKKTWKLIEGSRNIYKTAESSSRYKNIPETSSGDHKIFS